MDYTLPWDRMTLYWTVGTLALLALVSSGCLFFYRGALRSGAPAWPALGAGLVCLLVLAGTASMAPRGLSIRGSTLEVRRGMGSARYDLSAVSAVEVVPFETVFSRGTTRTFGIGGPFGLAGRFHSPELGSFRAAVTRRADLVLVRFAGAPPLVLSPGSPRDVAEALIRARGQGAPGSAGGGLPS